MRTPPNALLDVVCMWCNQVVMGWSLTTRRHTCWWHELLPLSVDTDKSGKTFLLGIRTQYVRMLHNAKYTCLLFHMWFWCA